MANYICYPATKVAEKNIEKVRVPAATTLHPGDVVMAETLYATDTTNRDVYLGAAVADATADIPCIVINQGVYELTNNQRPEWNADVTQITYTAGDVITVVRLEHDLKFIISNDCLDNTGVVAPAVNVHLTPVNADYQLATSADASANASYLRIERLESIGTGGQFGSGFASGVLARVIKGR